MGDVITSSVGTSVAWVKSRSRSKAWKHGWEHYASSWRNQEGEDERSEAIPSETYHGRWSRGEDTSACNFLSNNFLALFLTFLGPSLSASISSCDSCVHLRHSSLCSPSSITTMVVALHSQNQALSLTRYAQLVSIARPCPLTLKNNFCLILVNLA